MENTILSDQEKIVAMLKRLTLAKMNKIVERFILRGSPSELRGKQAKELVLTCAYLRIDMLRE